MAKHGFGIARLALCGALAAAAFSGVALADEQAKHELREASRIVPISATGTIRSGSAVLAGAGIESVQRGERTRLIQSGSPTVLRSFRPREGVLQSPAPADAGNVQRIGGGEGGERVITVDAGSVRARQFANDPVVAQRVGGSLTPDGMILVQADAGDVQPLIAVSPNELIDGRYREQFRRDHPYITDAQARRAQDAMIAGRAQWERETGLTGRVMQFNNADAARMYREDERRGVNHEPSAIIVPRGQGQMTDAGNAQPRFTPVSSAASPEWSIVPAYQPAPPTVVYAQPQTIVVPSVVVHRAYSACSSHWHRSSACVNTCRDRFRSGSGISISLSSGKGYAHGSSWHGHRRVACSPRPVRRCR